MRLFAIPTVVIGCLPLARQNMFNMEIIGDNANLFWIQVSMDQKHSPCKPYGRIKIIVFVEGLKRDFLAARNAIVLPYSNGLAEGKINKLKLIKRIMYGRCKFDTLRVKALLMEYHGHFN